MTRPSIMLAIGCVGIEFDLRSIPQEACVLKRLGLGYLGVLLGILIWPIDAVLHVLVFDRGGFIENLFTSDPDNLWMRTLMSLLFIGFGRLGQTYLNEHRELHARLEKKRHRLQQVIDSAYDAYIAIDDEGRVLGWNRSAEKMFGWSLPEVLGKELALLAVPEARREQHREGMRRYKESGFGNVLYKPVRVDALHRNGQTFPVEMVITPLKVADKPEFFAFVRKLDS